MYEFQVPWLIRKRRENGVPTWIVLGLALDSRAFKSSYAGLHEPLTKCLTEGFMELPLQQGDKR